MSAAPVFSEKDFGYDYASQPKERVEECPLCSCNGFVEVATHDRYGFGSPTHVCAQCGLAFLNPRMTREAYSEFYSGTYRHLVRAVHGKPVDEQELRRIQVSYGKSLAEFLQPLLSKRPETILDLGGGHGVVARVFADQYGSTVTVVDPSDEKAPRCERIVAFVEDWRPTQAYDLVLVCQTFDHVLNPRAALENARAAMVDGGLLYIDIVDWLADGTRFKNIRSGIKIDHPYGWTEGVMTSALVAHGLTIERMRYSSDGRHIGYACRKVGLGREARYQHGPVVLARCREVMMLK